MDETGAARADDHPPKATSWSRRMNELRADSDAGGSPGRSTGRITGDDPVASRRTGSTARDPDRADVEREAFATAQEDRFLEEGLERLRHAAREAARTDAERGRPTPEEEGPTDQEASLRQRCRTFYERWTLAERSRVRDALTDREERAAELMGRGSLLLDRFSRLSNELIRLKARRSHHRRAVETSLGDRDDRSSPHGRGLSTPVYAVAIGFLGLVEFFANAPVFSTLLPRDPLTERQIRVLAETTTGWWAGAERVLAQLVLRPDAALLAAGVVTFLCVLAHFFGHSLRELVMQQDRRSRRDTVATRSPMENAVPMVLTGLGLALVLGVLFEARVILGEVGERRHRDDVAAVAELRRESGWLRADGDLLAANERSNRADDMEAAATQLREYAASMSRMTFPILLLNLTLVLAAITAAYFHRRDGSEEHFNEDPYDDGRRALIDAAEATASELTGVLSGAVRPIRELRSLVDDGPSRDPRGVIQGLESVVALYREENARARGIVPSSVRAFGSPVELGLVPDGEAVSFPSFRRVADGAEARLAELGERFRDAREHFNRQLMSWEADHPDG